MVGMLVSMLVCIILDKIVVIILVSMFVCVILNRIIVGILVSLPLCAILNNNIVGILVNMLVCVSYTRSSSVYWIHAGMCYHRQHRTLYFRLACV